MADVAPARSALHAYINYFLELHEGGTDVLYPGTAIDKLRPLKATLMPIKDIRGSNEEFNLDIHGFAFVAHECSESKFDDRERITSVVYEEVTELIKRITGATRVVPFSHLVRNNLVETAIEAAKKTNPKEIIPIMTPSLVCHVDQSYNGARKVLDENLGDEGQKLSKTRWGIINIWRPIAPVHRDPLGVCDARSCSEDDLRTVFAQLPSKGDGSKVSRGDGFEVFNVAHNPAHKWYYASEMKPNEVLMIKCFDSKKDGRARRTPHTAFQTEEDYGGPRQSIEVRCLVFWEDQEVE